MDSAAIIPPLPSRTEVQAYQANAEFRTSPGDNPQFPTPFAVGGAPVQRPTAPPNPRPGTGVTKAAVPPALSAVPKTATPAGPNSVVVQSDDPNQLPGMNQPLYPTAPASTPTTDADPDAAKVDPTKKKPKKIDNSLLEKMIKNRNGTP